MALTASVFQEYSSSLHIDTTHIELPIKHNYNKSQKYSLLFSFLCKSPNHESLRLGRSFNNLIMIIKKHRKMSTSEKKQNKTGFWSWLKMQVIMSVTKLLFVWLCNWNAPLLCTDAKVGLNFLRQKFSSCPRYTWVDWMSGEITGATQARGQIECTGLKRRCPLAYCVVELFFSID